MPFETRSPADPFEPPRLHSKPMYPCTTTPSGSAGWVRWRLGSGRGRALLSSAFAGGEGALGGVRNNPRPRGPEVRRCLGVCIGWVPPPLLKSARARMPAQCDRVEDGSRSLLGLGLGPMRALFACWARLAQCDPKNGEELCRERCWAEAPRTEIASTGSLLPAASFVKWTPLVSSAMGRGGVGETADLLAMSGPKHPEGRRKSRLAPAQPGRRYTAPVVETVEGAPRRGSGGSRDSLGMCLVPIRWRWSS